MAHAVKGIQQHSVEAGEVCNLLRNGLAHIAFRTHFPERRNEIRHDAVHHLRPNELVQPLEFDDAPRPHTVCHNAEQFATDAERTKVGQQTFGVGLAQYAAH